MKKFRHSLFWKIALFFLLSLTALSAVYLFISYRTSMEYSQETSQRLNRSLASRVSKFTQPFLDGKPNKVELDTLFNNVMIINPSVEVYLLDNDGKIVSFYAPFGKVKLEQVDLGPIHRFIANQNELVKGEDPRNPGVFKVFSAAKVEDKGVHQGYIYIILASEEYTNVSDLASNSYRIKLATRTIAVTLITTLIIGLLIIWFLVKNLNRIVTKVQDFRDGDLEARIGMSSKGEIANLAHNIDSMADTIVRNIHEIKSTENLRKELIANVSHDLRTPLTSIQGYAETIIMLKDKLSEEEKDQYLNIILKSTHKVLKLVEDLFEISKLESNQVQAKMEKFSLHQLLSDIVAKYELLARINSVSFHIDLLEEDSMIVADKAWIERVFQNLLDNSLKHTSEGESIRIRLSKNDKNSVQILVQDTGIGIAKEELPYIFDRYKKSKNNTREGSGLGLAIVKKILDLHKIEISVSSQLRQGTTFSFHLPIAE